MNKTISNAMIETLKRQGCSAEDWARVRVSPRFDASRVSGVRFFGDVEIGDNGGSVEVDGVVLPQGIRDATVSNCSVGDGVSIERVGTLANLEIGAGAMVRDSAGAAAAPGARCGMGAMVRTANERGGRAVPLYPSLNAQVAFLLAFHRHDRAFVERMEALIAAEVEARGGEGTAEGGGATPASSTAPSRVSIGPGARIVNCGPLRDVAVGPSAHVEGADRLEDGTILSDARSPTFVGAGVWGRAFLIAEGARVDSGALLDHAFVGQASRVGKQFSAENALFFANCEAYHGEGAAIFCGPYTVSHHKSTLLVAGHFSFFNAGSGTNQSNHAYRLGAIHQGVFERGCKTGSFAYLLEPFHVGAFSVVIGKHLHNLRFPNLPFSYVLESEGRSVVIPAMALSRVGLWRDERKWVERDRRHTHVRRDLVDAAALTPYTIEKMRRGREELRALVAGLAPGKDATLDYAGMELTATRARRGAEAYGRAIRRYMLGRLVERLEAGASLAPRTDPGGGDLREWLDVGGYVFPRRRVEALEADVAGGRVESIAELERRLCEMAGHRAEDEWAYCCEVFEEEINRRPADAKAAQLRKWIDEWAVETRRHCDEVLADAEREFDASRIGYGFGLEGDESASAADFRAVRGDLETNAVAREILEAREAVAPRAEALRKSV